MSLTAEPSGYLNILKPPGMTSHDVVAFVRRLVGRKVKVGHLGTLDPAAGGVLPVAVGKATKTIDYVPMPRKQYLAELIFGVETDTLDCTGRILRRCCDCASQAQSDTGSSCPYDVAITDKTGDCAATVAADIASKFSASGSNSLRRSCCPSLERLQAASDYFRGEVIQVPPNVSALHVNGRRGYELVREGADFTMQGRPAFYHQVEALSVEGPRARLCVTCGPGTYIRALIRDLGIALGCPATMVFLLRTASGCFTLERSVLLEELRATGWQELLCPVEEILRQSGLDSYTVPMPDMAHFFRGQDYLYDAEQHTAVPVGRVRNQALAQELEEASSESLGQAVAGGRLVLLFTPEEQFLGLGRIISAEQRIIRVERVL